MESVSPTGLGAISRPPSPAGTLPTCTVSTDCADSPAKSVAVTVTEAVPSAIGSTTRLPSSTVTPTTASFVLVNENVSTSPSARLASVKYSESTNDCLYSAPVPAIRTVPNSLVALGLIFSKAFSSTVNLNEDSTYRPPLSVARTVMVLSPCFRGTSSRSEPLVITTLTTSSSDEVTVKVSASPKASSGSMK